MGLIHESGRYIKHGPVPTTYAIANICAKFHSRSIGNRGAGPLNQTGNRNGRKEKNNMTRTGTVCVFCQAA